MSVTARAVTAADWPAVATIYEAGIATGNATFKTTAPTREAWDTGHLPQHRLVAIDGQGVAGWPSLSGVSDRCVHAGVAENSVHRDRRGRGVRRPLLETLIADAESAAIWTIQTGIFPANTASPALHEETADAFAVADDAEPARLDGRRRDTCFLERRSPTVGRDDHPSQRTENQP